MPLTPLHIGHALPFASLDITRKYVDLISAIVGSMIVDIHGILILFLKFPGQLHGFMHSFFMATFLCAGVAVILHYTENYWEKILKILWWDQHTSLLVKIISATSMGYVHIFLDGMIYPEMHPGWPFVNGNPFYGWIESPDLYILCTIGGIVGVGLYILNIVIRSYLNRKQQLKVEHSSGKNEFYQFFAKKQSKNDG